MEGQRSDHLPLSVLYTSDLASFVQFEDHSHVLSFLPPPPPPPESSQAKSAAIVETDNNRNNNNNHHHQDVSLGFNINHNESIVNRSSPWNNDQQQVAEFEIHPFLIVGLNSCLVLF